MCSQCLATPEGARLWQAYEQANVRYRALQERDRQNQVKERNAPPDTVAAQQEEFQAHNAYQAYHNIRMQQAASRAGMEQRADVKAPRGHGPIGVVCQFPGAPQEDNDAPEG